MYKNVVNGNCGRPIGPARVAIGRPIGHDARDDDFVTMVSDEERPSFISPLALTKLSCNPEVLAEFLARISTAPKYSLWRSLSRKT
jgi:hypothetical protein